MLARFLALMLLCCSSQAFAAPLDQADQHPSVNATASPSEIGQCADLPCTAIVFHVVDHQASIVQAKSCDDGNPCTCETAIGLQRTENRLARIVWDEPFALRSADQARSTRPPSCDDGNPCTDKSAALPAHRWNC